jgi:type I restriction enzyme, S subunit
MADSAWPTLPLEELIRNFDSRRVPIKGADRKPGPFPYYGASGIVDSVDGYIFDGDYLLIAEDGENLRTRQTPIAFMATGKFWVNNHAHVVQGNDRASTRFLSYALAATDVSGYLSGSTMPKLTQGNLNRIPIIAPPIEEQRSIANILGTLDEKIELNRRMNTTLEAMAQVLFQSMFIDKIGDGLPNGWSEGTVSDVGLLSRASVTPGKFPDETFSHYSLPSFDEGRLPKQESGSEIMSNKTLVSSDSVLLSKLNPRIPRIWLPATNEPNRAISSTEFLVVSPKSGISREFLYCLFANDSFMSKLATMVTGTSGSHQRIKPDSLLDMQIVLPSKAAIRDFTNAVASMLQRVQSNIEQSRTLANLRDTLLPKLFSGEIPLNQK